MTHDDAARFVVDPFLARAWHRPCIQGGAMVTRSHAGAAALRAFTVVTALLAVAGCTSRNDEESESSEALTTATSWQGPDRFALGARGGDLDMTTAFWMAKMSELAYSPRAEIENSLSAWGVRPDRLVFFENTKTSTQGFYFSAGDDAVLAFRGTKELRDFLTDARTWTRKTPLGNVHAGFLGAFESVWTDRAPGLVMSDGSLGLASLLRAEQARRGGSQRVLVTGHSLGAALGTLAFAHAAYDDCLQPAFDGDTRALDARPLDPCFARGIRVHGLYTYGAPRVGDASFAQWLSAYVREAPNDRAVFRFVQAADVVTKVPDTFGSELFFHPSTISVSGKQTEREHLVYLTRARGVDRGGSSLEYASDKWRTRWTDYVGDHFVSGYLKTLLAHAADGANVNVAPLTAQKDRFERLKAAYARATPAEFVTADPSELGGPLALSLGSERVLRWTSSSGTFWVRRADEGSGTEGTDPDASDVPEEEGHVPLDVTPVGVDEIFDGAFELVATVERDPATGEIFRFEDPNDPNRR